MTVSVITPTCDRPVGLALAERWMARQTRQPDEWIVADGGRYAAVCTQGQRHLHKAAPAGLQNFTSNLLRAIESVIGDIVVIVEDDDWYAHTHLETLVSRLEAGAGLIAGDDEQCYYNVDRRCFRVFQNTGASLCQTAFVRALLPAFEQTVLRCARTASYGVDAAFWKGIPREQWTLERHRTVIGTKGLPGQPGLGIGHRPDTAWTGDADLRQLASWVGPDIDAYVTLGRTVACG